jgi:hypothetical protein
VIERMQGLRPGTSPPPVRIPIFTQPPLTMLRRTG